MCKNKINAFLDWTGFFCNIFDFIVEDSSGCCSLKAAETLGPSWLLSTIVGSCIWTGANEAAAANWLVVSWKKSTCSCFWCVDDEDEFASSISNFSIEITF